MSVSKHNELAWRISFSKMGICLFVLSCAFVIDVAERPMMIGG